jgi:hypothetical protein
VAKGPLKAEGRRFGPAPDHSLAALTCEDAGFDEYCGYLQSVVYGMVVDISQDPPVIMGALQLHRLAGEERRRQLADALPLVRT